MEEHNHYSTNLKNIYKEMERTSLRLRLNVKNSVEGE